MKAMSIDVYDTLEHKYLLIGTTTREVAELFKIEQHSINDCIRKKFRCQKRYLIVPAGQKINENTVYTNKVQQAKDKAGVPQTLVEEWDRIISNPYLWKTIKVELLGEFGKKFSKSA